MEQRLREEIRDIYHLDKLQQFDMKISQLALGLQKIWSFCEVIETTIRVKVRSAITGALFASYQAQSDVLAIVSLIL